jgi:hypothetical protein
MILVSAVICILLMLFMLVLGKTVDEAVISAMSMLYALLPVGGLLAIAIPMFWSAFRLRNRGIALTGSEMISKYAKANVMVFNDCHLFSRCSAKDIGFVCYEKNQLNSVMAGLQILYSRIGGPLGEVFESVPDGIRAKRIRVRRICKNGVEALIDKSHILIVGDLKFMSRYGIVFPEAQEKKKSVNATLYISYDGRATAKLSAGYRVEPMFDMLIERLSAEGGHCVIETYDPLINTAFVSKLRKSGRSPISVVHKNAADLNRCEKVSGERVSDNGILAVSSRFKMIEAVVWCNRLCKIEKLSRIAVFATMILEAALVITLAALGLCPYAYQYIMLTGILLTAISVLLITALNLPSKDYFSLAAFGKENSECSINNKDKKINNRNNGKKTK